MAHKRTTERTKELKGMNEMELTGALIVAHKAIYQVRRDRLSKPQVNVKETKANRKEIARILTIQREREIAAQSGSGR